MIEPKRANSFPRKPRLLRVINGKEVYSDKYTEEQKLFVVELAAQFKNSSEVAEAFKEKFGIEFTSANVLIGAYKKSHKWKPFFDKARDKYLADVHEVPGSHKKIRLDRADKIYERSFKRGKIKDALMAIEHQRKEMEERQTQIGSVNLTLNQINLMSDEELENRRKELLLQIQTPQEKQDG